MFSVAESVTWAIINSAISVGKLTVAGGNKSDSSVDIEFSVGSTNSCSSFLDCALANKFCSNSSAASVGIGFGQFAFCK